jgi:Fur family transcriptional regulator, ferric uptake regulator
VGAASHENWLREAEQRMREAGHRSGAVRNALLELLASEDCLLSAEQIMERLAEQGIGSRASVYRVLERLCALGLVHRLDDVAHDARYEIAEPEHHHHHVVVEETGEIVPFTDPVLEASIQAVAQRLGVTLTSHDVTLRGVRIADEAPAD